MFRMGEDRARAIDATCKILLLAGGAIGAWWTAHTYFNGRADQAKTEAVEARKPFESERLNFYIRATTAAATPMRNFIHGTGLCYFSQTSATTSFAANCVR
jgi:hypothetical protein